jgi:colicin import membrane protein
MKKPVIRSVGRLESIKTSDQKLSVPITVSFFGHVVFCLLFIVLPKITLDDHIPTRIINVQLVTPTARVTAPAPSVQPTPLPAAAQVEVPQPASEPSVSTAPKAEEAVSLAPKKIEKKQSMKKKTFKRERLLESAIKTVEKQVEASKADPKQQALDRIRSELAEKAAKEPEEDERAATAAVGMTGEGTPTSDILRIYYAEVAYRIQRNWAFSEQLAGNEEELYNEVGFKIMRNGEIRDLWFDRRSGNSYLDESARKAILKSSPLPPIPDEIRGDYIPLGARFTPEGIN